MMDATLTASGSRQSFRDADGHGVIVFDPARLRQADASLFDPASYGGRAEPVRGRGGRGAAWFVRGEFGDGVLRHYLRGGWVAHFIADGYLWLGESRTRCVREFRLLARLREAGLPVPAPIAAWYRRAGLGHRQAIIVGRIAGARTLVEAVHAGNAPWAAIGTAIARCHRQLARHADLNANNILLDPTDAAWLIDWDKGRIERAAGPWQAVVLDRLQRSLHKECGERHGPALVAGMASLRAAHDRELYA